MKPLNSLHSGDRSLGASKSSENSFRDSSDECDEAEQTSIKPFAQLRHLKQLKAETIDMPYSNFDKIKLLLL